jgi:hypothetical protein
MATERDLLAFAPALLDLLGARDGGRGVGKFSDAAVPIINMDAYLLVGRNELYGTQPVAIAAGGFIPIVQIPANRTWVLHAAHAQITTDVGEAASITLMCQPARRRSAGDALPLGNTATAAASQVRFSNLLYPGILLGPGTVLGYLVGDLVGNPDGNAAFYMAELTGA